jgi:hypothetical protein
MPPWANILNTKPNMRDDCSDSGARKMPCLIQKV